MPRGGWLSWIGGFLFDMAKRKTLSKKTRFEVFKRDSFTCVYCGSTPPKVVLEVDHILPVSVGGLNDMDNLVTSCFNCNRGKSNNDLETIPKTIQEKHKVLKEKEDQLKEYTKLVNKKRDRLYDETWYVIDILDPDVQSYPRVHMRSITMFIENIGYDEVCDAADIAVSKMGVSSRYCWKYFCGICWNKMRNNE